MPENWLLKKNQPVTAYWLCDVPTDLTFNNFTFRLHSVFVGYVFISEQIATFVLYNDNLLVFITQMKSVYSAVRTASINKALCASSLKG